MGNYIYDLFEIVYVPEIDKYGKIIDVRVDTDGNTCYMVVFDDGSWKSFLGYQLQGDGYCVL